MLKADMNRRFFLIASTAAVTAPGYVMAQTIDPKEARIRLNLATKLGMLAQRASKAATFETLGITVTDMQAQLVDADKQAGAIVDAMLNGNDAFGTTRERSVSVQFELEDLQTAWTTAMGGFVSETTALVAFANACAEISDMGTTVVETFKDVYIGPSIESQMANTLQLLGRQRELTQTMAGQLGRVLLGLDADANVAGLSKNHTIFGNTLTVLKDSPASYGLPLPPSEETVALLEEQIAVWGSKKDFVEAAINTSTLSEAQQAEFLSHSEALLTASDALFEVYQNDGFA